MSRDKLTIYLPPETMAELDAQVSAMSRKVGVEISKSSYIAMLIKRNHGQEAK